MDTATILIELRHQREKLDTAIAALEGVTGGRNGSRSSTNGRRHRRRTMSAAARKRISDAQKKRWAERRKSA
jgi:hypothetical protein